MPPNSKGLSALNQISVNLVMFFMELLYYMATIVSFSSLIPLFDYNSMLPFAIVWIS